MLDKKERNTFNAERNMDNKPVVAIPDDPSRIILVFRAVTGSVGGAKIDGFTRRVQRFDPTVGVIGFYDTTKLCYMTGADGVGDFDEFMAYLEKVKADYPNAKISTVGFSLGGYASLQYGIRLKAETVTALNPWTGFTDECIVMDPRGKRTFGYGAQHIPPGSRRDVCQLLDEMGYDGKITVFYSGGNPGDVFQSNRIKDYPQVTLYATDATSHAQTANILLHYGPEYYESLGLKLTERQKERLREKNQEELARQEED